MKVQRNFSETGLKHISLWAWAAAVLPITALAGIFFIWMVGPNEWVEILLVTCATVMFGVFVGWWWWIIWIVSRILKKDRRIAEELADTCETIKEVKLLVIETFDLNDK